MPKRNIVSSLVSEMVKGKLYGEAEDATAVVGTKTYIVNTMCTTDESEDPIPQDFTVQANSPEQAKTQAGVMAKEAGKKSCKVQNVEMVPNSGEELNDYGSGSALNANSNADDGQVKPSDISSDLDNGDA